MSTSDRTHDHQTIKKWAEERNGIPAKIKGTGNSNKKNTGFSPSIRKTAAGLWMC